MRTEGARRGRRKRLIALAYWLAVGALTAALALMYLRGRERQRDFEAMARRMAAAEAPFDIESRKRGAPELSEAEATRAARAEEPSFHMEWFAVPETVAPTPWPALPELEIPWDEPLTAAD